MRTPASRRFRRRHIIVLAFAAALAVSTAAWAYWVAPSSGHASGRVGTLAMPTITGASAGGGTVALSWTAVSAPGSGSVSYYVTRDGSSPSSACPNSATPGTQTSCTDTGVAVGGHSYTVTAVWRSWTA
ncbi:MAG TPA: hypothetical protein VK761_00645, partial [Solirubrobacteraceae bacterium]|nr:hypothetical protein [Solirubrobacteraceae bacterium]